MIRSKCLVVICNGLDSRGGRSKLRTLGTRLRQHYARCAIYLTSCLLCLTLCRLSSQCSWPARISVVCWLYLCLCSYNVVSLLLFSIFCILYLFSRPFCLYVGSFSCFDYHWLPQLHFAEGQTVSHLFLSFPWQSSSGQIYRLHLVTKGDYNEYPPWYEKSK